MEVFAFSSLINPGRISNDKSNHPKIFPTIGCLTSMKISFLIKIDSFHEIFKNTKVKIITNPDMFNTVSKGIGRSPTLPIP